MEDIEKIMKGSKKDFAYIGERLRMIREELVKKDTDNQITSQFSMKKLAERFDMNPMTIANVERGTISLTTIKLALYYYTLGYNMMWLFSYDNEFIEKHNIGENVVYQTDVQEEYKELESSIVDALMTFKKKI